MKNMIVKVSDYHLLQFFYPQMKVRSELSLLDRDNSVLYIGNSRPKLKEYLALNTKEFISVVGPAEMDLTDIDTLINFVFESRGKKPTKKILDMSKSMDLDYIEYLCKVYWVCGRWVADSEDIDVSMYSLFQATTSSLRELLKTYFELRKVYPYEVIEASIITFLSRVVSIEDQSVSLSYMKLLKQANQRFGPKIKPLMLRLGGREDNELSFIDFLTDLR